MALTIQPGTSPSGNPMIEFVGLPDTTKAKIVGLAQTLQMAAADGKITLTEDLMLGIALMALFSK